MLEDVAKIRRVVLAYGTADLRKGIDGLSMMIGDKYHQNPFEKEPCFFSVADALTRSIPSKYTLEPMVTIRMNSYVGTDQRICFVTVSYRHRCLPLF